MGGARYIDLVTRDKSACPVYVTKKAIEDAKKKYRETDILHPNNANNLDKVSVKSKVFGFILYPDNDLHMSFLNGLMSWAADDVAYIKHSPDVSVDENGEIVEEDTEYKAHFHVMVRYGYSKSFTTVIRSLKPFGITYAKPINAVDAMLKYFVHCTYEARASDKPLYSFDDIFCKGNYFKYRIGYLRYIQSNGEYNPMSIIAPLLESCNSMIELYAAIAQNALLDDWVGKHQYLLGILWDEQCRLRGIGKYSLKGDYKK